MASETGAEPPGESISTTTARMRASSVSALIARTISGPRTCVPMAPVISRTAMRGAFQGRSIRGRGKMASMVSCQSSVVRSQYSGAGACLGERVELRERFVHGRDLPLLPAEVSEADGASLVDDEESRALAEGDHGALDVVHSEDLAVWIGHAGEGNLVRLEVAAGVVESVRRQGDDLSAALRELLVPVPQLREMPAAERSNEAAQEDHDDGLPAQAGE